MMKRITDEEFKAWIKNEAGSQHLSMNNCRFQAQLEADQKAHDAIVREIKKDTEDYINSLLNREESDWHKIWQKYGVKDGR